MPYHRLGEGKLERLGLSPDGRARAETPSRQLVESWLDALTALGVPLINERAAPP